MAEEPGRKNADIITEKPEAKAYDEEMTAAASFLAENFASLCRRQQRLQTLKDFGPIRYTEGMAIRDLSAVSIRTDSDKVQSSNISNVPERILMTLEDGYVEKMQNRMNREYKDTCRELEYVNWQLDVIRTAMQERMTQEERVIFRYLFQHGMSVRDVRRQSGETLSIGKISKCRKRCIAKTGEELSARRKDPLENANYNRLMKDIRHQPDE